MRQLLAPARCRDSGPGHRRWHTAAAAVAVLGLLQLGCENRSPTTVHFLPMLQGADLNCDSAVEIADFKMYLSAIALRDAGGRWIDIALTQTGPWQNAEVALLSVDSCQALNGNLAVTGTWPGSQPRGLRFDIAVPDTRNHADPTQASSPLNVPSMFWTWQQGYKFVRLDGQRDGKPWAFHLGSSGCVSPTAIRPPAEPCRQPNRARVVLDNFDGSQAVVINLDALVEALSAPVAVNCTGRYEQSEACSKALGLFGLDAERGRCEATGCRQQIFSLTAAPP